MPTAPKKKVLPGIEPGFRDSESPVITVTLQDHGNRVALAYPCVTDNPQQEPKARWDNTHTQNTKTRATCEIRTHDLLLTRQTH